MEREHSSIAETIKWVSCLLFWFIVFYTGGAFADTNIPILTITPDKQGQTYSLTLQVLFAMTVLTLLPALVLGMTCFTRIIIVLSLLRQAVGLPQTPPNPILLGLSLFLTFFLMQPIFNKIYQDAWQPYTENKISLEEAMSRGGEPLKTFMLKHTREQDLQLFTELSQNKLAKPSEAPLHVLVPAFMISELKTAFQIGFLIFLPFLVIDLVVSSVLMAMGMMMLSPMMVSLPFKIMLFVLVDGWSLLIGSLAKSVSGG